MLLVAQVLGEAPASEGLVAICCRCGAYFFRRAMRLTSSCPGVYVDAPNPGRNKKPADRRRFLARFYRGQFPNASGPYSQLRLGESYPPSSATALRIESQHASIGTEEGGAPKGPSAPKRCKRSILNSVGAPGVSNTARGRARYRGRGAFSLRAQRGEHCSRRLVWTSRCLPDLRTVWARNSGYEENGLDRREL